MKPWEKLGCPVCDYQDGWIIRKVRVGPANPDGTTPTREEVKPCPECRPADGQRIEAPRDDPPIQRHRRHQDRRMGRTDD